MNLEIEIRGQIGVTFEHRCNFFYCIFNSCCFICLH